MKKISIKSLENFHILLWILKDVCWFIEWKVAGIIISLPTLVVAVVLCIYTKKNTLIFLPNLAVLMWLLANISWMYLEFFEMDIIWLPLSFFAMGLIFMIWYYIPKKDNLTLV